MSSSSCDDPAVHETIFAYRHHGHAAWQINSWECDAAQVAEEIALKGWDLDSIRIIREFHHHRGLLGILLHHAAADAHWLWAPEPEGWYPMEQELPPAAGAPSGSDVSFAVRCTTGGSVEIGVTSGLIELTVRLDTTHHRRADLVRFADLLEAGQAPHVCFPGNNSIIDDVVVLCVWRADAGRIRLRVRH